MDRATSRHGNIPLARRGEGHGGGRTCASENSGSESRSWSIMVFVRAYRTLTHQGQTND